MAQQKKVPEVMWQCEIDGYMGALIIVVGMESSKPAIEIQLLGESCHLLNKGVIFSAAAVVIENIHFISEGLDILL